MLVLSGNQWSVKRMSSVDLAGIRRNTGWCASTGRPAAQRILRLRDEPRKNGFTGFARLYAGIFARTLDS
jgi:hypothetical protein